MSNPRRILFISHSATRTGAPIALLNLMRWLKSHTDFELETLIAGDGPLVAEFARLGPLTVLAAPRRHERSWRQWARRLGLLPSGEPGLRSLAARRDFDLVYSNTIINGSLLEALEPLGCPVVTQVHELEYWIWRSGQRNLRSVMRHTSLYIAVSESVRRNLVQQHGIDEARVALVHESVPPSEGNSANRELVRRSLGIPQDAPIVVGSGCENWRKGTDLFVQLATRVSRSSEDAAHFVWVGSRGTAEERYQIEHDIARTGLTARIHFVGEVENPLDYFAAADLFVLTSREDPFPLVCLEAASVGKPIVCFADAGGMPEFVRAEAGIVVPYLDVDAMAKAVTGLRGDPILRERLGRRAAEKVRTSHTFDVVAPQIVDLIRSLM